MPPIDVLPDHSLLLRVLRDPNQLDSLSPVQFGRLLDAAGQARLLGWLLSQLDGRPVPTNAPEWLIDRVIAIRGFAGEYERAVRWEIDRLQRAFLGSHVKWILLKGGAYVAAQLPMGRARRVADLDILVPYARLADVEHTLAEHGWHVGELDPYDATYYREWMHELPPLVHVERRSVVDVHHAILPRTSRLRPSSTRLIERSITIDGNVRVLCPSHMVLHAAAHLFHDGEIAGAIRDVVDIDALLRHFGQSDDFWRELKEEARELDLTRPAYYALRYARRLLATPVPADVLGEVSAWAPPAAVRLFMDALVQRALPHPSHRPSSAAAFALYVRSHWLRMPPRLLIRHLARKGLQTQRTRMGFV
jgi:hypothetical protein